MYIYVIMLFHLFYGVWHRVDVAYAFDRKWFTMKIKAIFMIYKCHLTKFLLGILKESNRNIYFTGT